nr:hypothetical protein [Lachnospiraceae bacterium]
GEVDVADVAEEFVTEAVVEAAGSETAVETAGAAEAVVLTDTPSTGGDPISWNSIYNEDVIAPFFQYEITGTTSDHVANGKKYDVSANGGVNGMWRILFGNYIIYEDNSEGCELDDSVSSCVFMVPQKGKSATDDGLRLIVLNKVCDNYEREGTLYSSTHPLTKDGIPYVLFDGRKVGTKESAKERDAIKLQAALVKYDATTGKTELIANSGSMNATGAKAKPMLVLSAKAKNNINATISNNFLKDKDGNDSFAYIISENKNIKKETDHPYFTINVKVNDDKSKTLKDYKSRINKAVAPDGTTLIKKFQFPFEIRRNYFAELTMEADAVSDNIAEDAKSQYHGTDYTHWGDLLGGEASTTLQLAKDNTPVKIKGTDGDIKIVNEGGPIYKVNKKTGVAVDTGKDWVYRMNKAGKTGDSNLKKGDYTTKVITDPSGSSDGILIVSPCGNFEGSSAAFRTAKYKNDKGVEVLETRMGVYNADNFYFVYSAD